MTTSLLRTDLKNAAGFLDGRTNHLAFINGQGQRFFHEHGLARFRRRHDLVDMARMGGGVDNSVDGAIGENRFDRIVQGKSLLFGEVGNLRRRADGAGGKTDLVRFVLYRLDEHFAPPAKADNGGINHCESPYAKTLFSEKPTS